MTISIIKSICIFATLLLTSQFIVAQSGLNQKFDFDGSDSEKEYFVNVNSNATDMKIKFTGNITDGALTVRVIDPAGNSQNGFHLVCSENSAVTVQSKGSSGTSTIVRSGSGSNDEDVIEIKTGGTTTITTKSGSGSDKVNVESYEVSDKDKEKKKSKSKNKNSNSNSNDSNKSRSSYTYTVEDDNDRGAKGVIEEIMGDPAPGRWKFIVVSEGAKGSLEMIVKQNQ